MAWQHIEEAVLAWISENPEVWDDPYYESQEIEHRRLRDSVHRGPERVAELLNGHPRRFLELLRMNQATFLRLVEELRRHGVAHQRDVTVEEKLMYTLLVLGQGWNTRTIQEHFIRAATTVCHYVCEVVEAMNKMAKDYHQTLTTIGLNREAICFHTSKVP